MEIIKYDTKLKKKHEIKNKPTGTLHVNGNGIEKKCILFVFGEVPVRVTKA